MKGFSVLMSVYSKEKLEYLREALDSVFNQSVISDQVVLILDGPLGTDLQLLVDKLADQHPSLEIYPLSENRGLSAALRYGIGKCRNELVMRMDTDDICYPNRFEEMVRLFEKNPDLEVAGSFATSIDENGNQGKLMTVPTTEEDISRKVWVCPFIHPTVCFRKTALLRVGSYSENPGPRQDDYELWFRVVSGGLKCLNLDKPLLYYRFTSGNIARNSIRVGWARFKVGIKGAWKCNCTPIAYIGVAYPLFRSLMPSIIRKGLYKISDKFNPRVK